MTGLKYDLKYILNIIKKGKNLKKVKQQALNIILNTSEIYIQYNQNRSKEKKYTTSLKYNLK